MATEYISHIVDAGHMRNIGEQSISNKIQAVLELVKNAYDGDATKCFIRFYGKKENTSINIVKIEIEDNGIGMTKYDIKNKLMKVGTANKIEEKYSLVNGRRVSGAKGMGHYSMQRLGMHTKITTTPKRVNNREEFQDDDFTTYALEIDWNEYVPGKNFHNITHKLTTQSNEVLGTKIEITGLKDFWNIKSKDKNNDIDKVIRVIKGIILPKKLQHQKKQFEPHVETIGFELEIQEVKSDLFEHASYKMEAFLDKDGIRCKIFKKNDEGGGYNLEKTKIKPIKTKCGNAKFFLHWYAGKTKWEKGIFRSRDLKNILKDNFGIKIYNDDVRIMPYGEKGNDWLGLDTRKSGGGSGGLVRNSTLIGYIEITRDENPDIIETTSREAIKENSAFHSFKSDFVMKSIEEFESAVSTIRKEDEDYQIKTIPENIAKSEILKLKEMNKKLKEISKNEQKIINASLSILDKQIESLVEQRDKIKEELTDNIEMYRNLASIGIQTIAFNHEIIDPIRYIKVALANLDDPDIELSENEKEKIIKRSRNEIKNTLHWANRIREFSSILAGVDKKRKRDVININDVLLELKANLSTIFTSLDITMNDPVIIDDVPHIKINKASFESIFINLVSNSVRALRKIRDRKRCIDIKIYKDKSSVIFEFKDNGYGISSHNKDDIFKPFFTTYNNPSDRGTGMGLTIVKEIVEIDYLGTIYLRDSVFEEENNGEGTTTFVIKLPLSKVGTQ